MVTRRSRIVASSTATKKISVPFSHLVIYHREIGTHRGHGVGFSDVFKFRTLRDMPFIHLASKVKDAYEGKRVTHAGWSEQRDVLRWFVELGRDGIYALDAEPIEVRHSPFQRYYLVDGHHRALALFILGNDKINAALGR